MSPLTLQLNFQKTATNNQGFLPFPMTKSFPVIVSFPHKSLSFQRERSFFMQGLSRVLSR